VTLMCQLLGVSARGFFEHRQRCNKAAGSRPGPGPGPGPKRVGDEALVAHILAIRAEFKSECGWPRV
jgi:hypothetical protein